MIKKFIAYEGVQCTLEWYFDARGKSKALEYFKELPRERQKKAYELFKFFADRGKVFNVEKFRYEGDQIYAIKPAPDRFLCFFYHDSKIIITNAYEKKTDKMPVREKEKALKGKEDYIKRYKEKTYYE